MSQAVGQVDQIEHVELVFCVAWDPRTRAVIAPIDEEEARRLDASGARYAVVMLVAGRLWGIAEVAWHRNAATVYRIDETGRRTGRRDLRRGADGRVSVIKDAIYRYAGPDSPEFDETAWQMVVTYDPNGWVTTSTMEHGRGGGSFVRPVLGEPGRFTYRRPRVGRWARHAATEDELAPDITYAVLADVPPTVRVSRRKRPVETLPRPLPPGPLVELFTDGSTCHVGEDVVTTSVLPAGRVALPTGRLVAADPTYLPDVEPFTTELPPGGYPVDLALVTFEDQEHVRVAAARLTVGHGTAASWEPALKAGQDPLMLGDGEFYGFGVDAGLAAFFDASYDEVPDPDSYLDVDERHPLDLDGRLVVFRSGWGDGSYPAWLGHDENGALVSVVIDFIVVS